MKIRPVEAEFFHGDGQTDRQTDARMDIYMTKSTVAFHNFSNAPKSGKFKILLQQLSYYYYYYYYYYYPDYHWISTIVSV